jgi:hypothetical protein
MECRRSVFGGVIRPERRCRFRILTVVVIFGSYGRFLGGDHDRRGAEDLDLGAFMLRAIPPLTRRRCGVVVPP